MIKLRRLAIVVFSALLTGSAAYSATPVGTTPKCPPPGKHSATSCYYKLTITKIIDAKQGVVMGKVPQIVVDENDKSCRDNNKDPNNPCPDPKKYQHSEYKFTIDGGASNSDVNKTIQFDSNPDTDRLKRRP